MRILSALLLLFWLTPAKAADTVRCIQNPKRIKACPHLLYRVAQLPDMTAPAVICICVSDFEQLLVKPTDEAQTIKLNMTKRQLEVQHGNKLQPVLDILQRQN
ncbi:hypothetical protein HRH59_16345 [Rheinheimera sp. YQF-2]|uniref:Secreted protein n=1 Tax=Rheinheimera lutimaris TaxID=2740584 RepID=A0A7Y5EJ07_9GAMM|nr:hypothetical protein [Rheinheimera lutimaris]NRQ44115.1 hypothetical protein [Rheinheimera lutimaris]